MQLPSATCEMATCGLVLLFKIKVAKRKQREGLKWIVDLREWGLGLQRTPRLAEEKLLLSDIE